MRDTICALSTPVGRGAIAIIRVSGPDVIDVYRKLTHKHTPPKPRYAHLVSLFDREGHLIDRGLCVFFKSPNSYTGEDMAEFYTHGGYIIPDLVLKTLYFYGIRQASPGEFTKRAFLSGKMDLLEAESVNEIINARTEEQFKRSLFALKGNLKRELDPILEIIKSILMEIEARIEFEEDVGPLDREKVLSLFVELEEKLNEIIKRAKKGRYLSLGVQVAIVGSVNVGKSTLFNYILGKERSIVTPYAGTTRDTVHEEVEISGLPVRFIDTAGIREAQDPVEKIGIERSKKALKEADFAIFVEDATNLIQGKTKDLDFRIPFIKVANKIDLLNEKDRKKVPGDYIMVSAKYGDGMDTLIKELEKQVKSHFYAKDSIILKSREMGLIEGVLSEIKEAKKLFERNIDELELISYHLYEAEKRYRDIFGYIDMPEKVLDEIFKDFCIGK